MKTVIFGVHKNVIMKRALTLAVAAMGLSAVTANAQLPAGSIAPNWTYSDINSQSHTLYNYLDSGYTVIMDISAAWCPPCWSMHQSHVADSLTKHYGANGTIDPKKIKFIYFEGESTNTTAQLTGTVTNQSHSGFTQGNWVANTNYPFIDQAGILNSYPVGGFPTFYVICPNRTISFVQSGYASTMGQESFWTAKQQVCPVATQPADGSIAGATSDINTCAGTPVALSTTIQNMGTQPLTSATVKALVNNVVVATQNWTGNLAKYGFATITFPNYTPTTAGTLKYEVTVTGDANAANNSQTAAINPFINATQNNVRVEIKTDNYPTETIFTLKNGATVIDTKTYTGPGAGGGPNANMVFTYDYPNLPLSACLTVEVTDGYGDGLDNGTAVTTDDGYVKIIDRSNNQTLLQIAGNSFTEEVTRKFKTGATNSINDVAVVNSIAVTPNPTTGDANVSMNLAENATVALQVVDMTGRVVYQLLTQKMNAGVRNLSIPSASFAAGAYQVNVVLNGGAISQRLTVIK